MDNKEQPRQFTRRRALRLGTISVGAIAGTGLAARGMAAGTDSGADGAPTSDPRFGGQFAAAAAETSYNGWPVGTPASAINVKPFVVPGTDLSLSVRAGDVATVLVFVAQQFNIRVEALIAGQLAGYSYRRNVNNPSVWSNHASGTAIDLNFALHPNGATGTFTAAQVAEIRKILAYCNGVVYWGGDYTGTVDSQHFEINVPPGESTLPALATKIGRTHPDDDSEDDMWIVSCTATNGNVYKGVTGDGVTIRYIQTPGSLAGFQNVARGSFSIERADWNSRCADVKVP